jgi:hypothetical protein
LWFSRPESRGGADRDLVQDESASQLDVVMRVRKVIQLDAALVGPELVLCVSL